MRLDDLALLRTPGPPAVSPDGRLVVTAVTRLDLASDAVLASLVAVPTDASGPPRALTTGARDSAPAFSPDGRWLAYLSSSAGAPPQLCVLPTAGGAPRCLTDLPLGAGRPVWSPDSRRLAWTSPVRGPGSDGGVRLLTTVPMARDGFAFPVDCRHQVHLLDLPADLELSEAVPVVGQLTADEVDSTDVCWSPDGSELAFVSARHEGAADDQVTDVYAVRPDGSGLRRTTSGTGRCSQPAWSPSGDVLYVAAAPDPGPDGLPRLCRVGPSGVLEPVPGVPAGVVLGPVVTADGVLVGVARHGAVELLRVAAAGPESLIDGPFRVRGMGEGGGVVVAAVGHDGSAGELLAITPGRRRLLTGFGRPLAETGRVHRSRERVVVGTDGGARGWLAMPAGAGPHPVLLRLCGAGWEMTEDVQVFVTAGYAVLSCAPAGDAAIALLDTVVADVGADLDVERVGVIGGALASSPGSHRFAAAVVEPVPGSVVPGGVDVPTLVTAAEDDARPGSAALGWYVELRRRDVPAELLLLPRPVAGLDSPRGQLGRLEHALGWFDRWLKPGDRPGPTAAGDSLGTLPAEPC